MNPPPSDQVERLIDRVDDLGARVATLTTEIRVLESHMTSAVNLGGRVDALARDVDRLRLVGRIVWGVLGAFGLGLFAVLREILPSVVRAWLQ